METLFPAMLEYMESKYPIFFGSPISELGFHQLFYFHCTLEDVFTRKQWIDVYKMKIVMYMPHTAYLHKHGKALIGAAVRISKDIGKPEFKDMLEETVPDYFKANFPFEVENEDRVDPGYMQEKFSPEKEDCFDFGLIWSHPAVQKSIPTEMKQSMAEGPDDFNEVPEKIQIKIVSYIETTLFPAILNHIASESSDSCQYGSLEKFCEDIDSLASSFVQTNREYLLKLNNVTEMPNEVFLKIYGKDLIGAAIHISKAMGKPNFVDELQDIVEECFIPNEEPDLTYPWRELSFKW